jgi:hypothetical protein
MLRTRSGTSNHRREKRQFARLLVRMAYRAMLSPNTRERG